MKKIISIMMVAVALIGGSVNAANRMEGSKGNAQQKELSKESKGKAKKGGKSATVGNKPQFNPFEGIQLSEDQQKRLQVLRQGLGPVQLTPEQQAKIKENKNLTKEQKKELKEERKAKRLEAKKNYLNGVKEILTPDQYVLFLENSYIYYTPQQKGQAQKQGKMGKVNKDKKKDHRKKGMKNEKKD